MMWFITQVVGPIVWGLFLVWYLTRPPKTLYKPPRT